MNHLANSITINGVTITGGRSISIINGKVTIDGKDVTPDGNNIKIEVSGDIDQLEADVCEYVKIGGSAGSVSTQSGDVECGPVTGSVKTMSGDVDCSGDIGGSVQTMSGDVTAAGQVSGGADSMSGRIRGLFR